jgi:hypothetical protein
MEPFWMENQLVQTKKQSLKGELMIFRTKMQARDQCRVQLKDSIHIEFLFCELEKDFALQGESCT